MVSKMGYLRAKMKELQTDGMMEVLMEKLKGNLLVQKMETIKGEPMVKLMGLMKVKSWGLITGNF